MPDPFPGRAREDALSRAVALDRRAETDPSARAQLRAAMRDDGISFADLVDARNERQET